MTPGDEMRFRLAVTFGVDVPVDEWTFFLDGVRVETFEKGARLVREGGPVDRAWYILAGIVRIHDGAVTYGFDYEGRFVSDTEAFFFGGDSATTVEALEAVTAIAIPRELLETCYDRHRCWDRIGRLQATEAIRRRVDKERRIRSLTPEERYVKLERESSPLLDRVPQYHLAAYLGIAPETLSRIRART